jgi:NAD(P)-dependent dehydrogenase (short-subunit alcohol dehydrogenase family)
MRRSQPHASHLSKGRRAYSAIKHAVIGLTRSAALEQTSQGIRINAVCPGIINTPMAIEATRHYDPQIVKAMVAGANWTLRLRPLYGLCTMPWLSMGDSRRFLK